MTRKFYLVGWNLREEERNREKEKERERKKETEKETENYMTRSFYLRGEKRNRERERERERERNRKRERERILLDWLELEREFLRSLRAAPEAVQIQPGSNKIAIWNPCKKKYK